MSTNLITACRDMREARNKLYELNTALGMALEATHKSVDSLHAATKHMPLGSTPLDCCDAKAAINKALADQIDGAVSRYEAQLDLATEYLDEECERRGLNAGRVYVALCNAAQWREAIRASIREARASRWDRDPTRYSNSASPLRLLRRDLRTYRTWMTRAFTARISERGAA